MRLIHAMCTLVAFALAIVAEPALAAPLHLNPATVPSSQTIEANGPSIIATAPSQAGIIFSTFISPRGSLAASAADHPGDRPADGSNLNR